MKNGMKFLAAGAALLGAAVGVAAYRKYKDSYDLIFVEAAEDVVLDEDNDFEQIAFEDDDFTYYIEDADQIIFHE